MKSATCSSVVIIEDHHHLAQQLQTAITQCDDFDCLAVLHSFEEAKVYLMQHSPQLVLVDLGLPDGCGEDLITLVEQRNQTHQQSSECLVLTMYGDEGHVMRALEAGAVGYLLKDASHEQIIKGLRDIVQGGSPISPVIARALLNRFPDEQAHPDEKANPELTSTTHFTGKEKEVLSLFAKGFTRKEIAKHLQVSVNTINTHAKRIYKKLAVHSQNEAVFVALQQGAIKLD